MATIIKNGIILTPQQKIVGGSIVIEDGKFKEILPSGFSGNSDDDIIDAKGNYVCPGFIDIHFHGALGKDVMDADGETLRILSDYCASHGVTSFYPTTWSASPEDTLSAVENVKRDQFSVEGAQILGMHLEGPYIGLKYRGAQLPSMIRPPEEEEYQTWFSFGIVNLITLAPEVEGSLDLIKKAADRGIRVSIGHSSATYDQVIEAANYGASQATHVFNGMSGLHHREPGTVGGILDDDRIFAQVICDGVHVHPATVRILVKAKSLSRVILITDSIRGAALPDGSYDHKGQKFTVTNGVARTPEGGLSGSTLSMDMAVKNAAAFLGCPIEDAISMATITPAVAMGVNDTKGWIAPGYDADLTFMDQDFQVVRTMVNGKIVFEKE